jgi:hypothetical protein
LRAPCVPIFVAPAPGSCSYNFGNGRELRV